VAALMMWDKPMMWDHGENMKIIKVLLGPDLLKPEKAGLRTMDDVFVRDKNAFNIGNSRSRRRVEV
jgi:hypothetical protein